MKTTSDITLSAMKKGPELMKIWPFIRHFLKGHGLTVFLFVSCSLFAGVWNFCNSALLKDIINITASAPKNLFSALSWPGIFFILNYEFGHLAWRGIQYINYKKAYIIKNNMIMVMFNYLHHHTPQFFHTNLVGSLVSQIKVVADNMERILSNISCHIIRGIFALLIAFVGMYLVHPVFFYVLFIWFVLFIFVTCIMLHHLMILGENQAVEESILMGQITDSMNNASTVRIFARSAYEKKYIDTFLKSIKKAYQKKEIFAFFLYLFQGVSITVLLSFMLYYLCHLYKKDLITSGDFALILGLSADLGYLVWWTMEQVDEGNKARSKCQEGLKSIFLPLTVKDDVNALPLQVTKGEIVFSNVTFQYNEKNVLFQNLSVTIPAKKKIALVGYSGSGKSSFFNMLLRLYDIVDGHIFIDHQDIRHVTQESLHKSLSLIPQDPHLFDRSIMENIRYGRLDASDEEVVEAAKKAFAHEFIINLAEGYATCAGENGRKLSGGQRQRVAIARAILKNTPILLMDEATSQLDALTEKKIQESLMAFMQDKTTLVIAHRLSTLIHMDRIMVFDKGCIVEDGNHHELMKKDGLYAQLWNTQKGDIISDYHTIL